MTLTHFGYLYCPDLSIKCNDRKLRILQLFPLYIRHISPYWKLCIILAENLPQDSLNSYFLKFCAIFRIENLQVISKPARLSLGHVGTSRSFRIPPTLFISQLPRLLPTPILFTACILPPAFTAALWPREVARGGRFEQHVMAVIIAP